MGARLLLLSWALVLGAGCSKHQPAADANPATNTIAEGPPAHGPGPMPSTSMPAVIPDTGNTDATLSQLTSELRKYVIHTRSVPKDFEEFIAKSGVQAPAPPAGKKYAIQNKAVVLVKR